MVALTSFLLGALLSQADGVDPALVKARDSLAIGGIKLGMSSGQVVNLIGLPSKKSGDMAGSMAANAEWKKLGLSVLFFDGRVGNISSTLSCARTTCPQVGDSAESITKAYVGRYTISDDDSGYLEKIQVPALGLSYLLREKKIVRVLLSEIDQLDFDEEAAAKKLPDYGIEIVDSTGETSFNPSKRDTIVFSQVRGRVKNKLDEAVDVELTAVWREKGDRFQQGQYLDSEAITVTALQPGEVRKFTIQGGGFVRSHGSTEVYSIEIRKLPRK